MAAAFQRQGRAVVQQQQQLLLLLPLALPALPMALRCVMAMWFGFAMMS
jgi:hypothetical protein